MRRSAKERSTKKVDDKEKGLHVTHEQGYLSDRSDHWWRVITDQTAWHRVRYKSGRFGKECETPCWTAFFGGRKEYSPFSPVPDWLRPLVDRVSSDCNVPFNAMLLRLYFDGSDEIAWHTDGRTFLGDRPTIASLSLGANATFQMRRMTNVWPPTDGSGGDCVDRSTPQRDFVVGDGDLFVMREMTQKKWHHRVPKQKGRRPRININFRYIMDGADAERGQKTYYKYMVHGDEEKPTSLIYKEIMAKKGGMMNYVAKQVAARGNVQRDGGGKEETDDRRESLSKLIQHQDKKEEESEASYLSSEGVEASVFRALPVNIRRELVDDWTSRWHRKKQQKRAPAPARAPKKRARTGTNKGTVGGGTIKAFFSSK